MGRSLKLTHILHDGGSYELENPFTGKRVKRAAEKVKKCHLENPWVLQPQEMDFPEGEEDIMEELPPHMRRPPRRFIEEF